MIRDFLLPTLAIAGAVILSTRKPRAGEYVGVNHPGGEMRLTLAPAGEFRMTLSVWDPVVGTAVTTREIVGRWRRVWGKLELRSQTRKLVYQGAARDGARWVWKQSNLPTFADGIVLVPASRPVSRCTPE